MFKLIRIAAQLMAAGANQQLIVSKLEPPAPPPLVPAIPAAMPSAPAPGPKVEAKPAEAGTLSVSHKPNIPDSGEVHVNGKEIRIDDQGNLKSAAEAAKAASLPKPTEEPKPLPLPASEAEKPAQPVEDKKPDKTPPGPHSFLDSKGGAPNMSAASGPSNAKQAPPNSPRKGAICDALLIRCPVDSGPPSGIHPWTNCRTGEKAVTAKRNNRSAMA